MWVLLHFTPDTFAYLRACPVASEIIKLFFLIHFVVLILKYMGELGCTFEVYRNDELTVEELKG